MGKESDLSPECQKFVRKLFAFFSKEKATKKPIVSFDRKNVLQRLQNIKCFWKKNPINFRVQISPRPCIMDFFPQFLYWIFQFTDFSQDYSWIVCHILKNPKRTWLQIKFICFINYMTLICLDACQWSLMSLITGNK
jgi:hypothetical protein